MQIVCHDYTLLDFPSLDQAKWLSFIKTMSGVMDWRKMVGLADMLW